MNNDLIYVHFQCLPSVLINTIIKYNPQNNNKSKLTWILNCWGFFKISTFFQFFKKNLPILQKEVEYLFDIEKDMKELGFGVMKIG